MMKKENVRFSCWNGAGFSDVTEYSSLGGYRVLGEKHDPREYYDERTPYDELYRRYYMAKYLIIFQNELSRLRASGANPISESFANLANVVMGYRLRFEETFGD